MSGPTFNKEKASFNIARIKKGGKHFEIAIDSDAAIAFKENRINEIRDVLKSEHIFTNSKKGELASEKELVQLFQTADPLEVASMIIKKGEIQLTAEHRAKLREEKRKKILEIIHTNGVDPRTHAPHPMTRLENAFEGAKIKIDDSKSAEAHIQDILRELRPILPINFEIKEIAVKIPAEFAMKCYSTVKSFGSMLREEWQKDGSWVAGI